jgi:anthranilate synthase component II
MSSKILVLDNYDSFTYNLVQYIEEITQQIPDVFRNDAIAIDTIEKYDYIILSPGPGVPSEAGIMPEVIKKYASTKKILGVCLGMQAIGEAFGGTIYNLDKVYHGLSTPIQITDNQEIIFKNIPNTINVGRYHSWAVAAANLPSQLRITAIDENGVVMALRHTEFDICGVQFHPESIMTDYGKQMLINFFEN